VEFILVGHIVFFQAALKESIKIGRKIKLKKGETRI
jgi:hypothetical protein